ncbi:MAG: UDP-N-acetylglucosamine 1-carboxyvinyltransferase [Candidatus Desulfofervidaceae bacterium]|nr:UDP-N-acetylglucosamine 1-carboxyvinyltransferase [Candidatus Desulfofervidaceae bacterium]MDL1970484.1 UDP-N-acetylglucosamine 1-carboxyvinyltransferase [Candidatus Desulfofervidaceae bacterium]
MDKFIIYGGKPLKGKVAISGAKNAALPMLVASLLTKETITYYGVPNLKDIFTIKTILTKLGVDFSGSDPLIARAQKLRSHCAPYELVRTMRASILVLGPLLARFKKAYVSLPGGCAIGARPVDLHLRGLTQMGAEIRLEKGYIKAETECLKGAEIYLDIPTVTGTENLMMAASLAKGTTVIRNAACEPEVTALARMLKQMGAEIEGEGTDVIYIRGVDALNGTTCTIIPDRIEAGTYMAAAGITGGEIYLQRCPLEFLGAVVDKLREAGLTITSEGDMVKVTAPSVINSTDITTLPYPGFPTDMQAQFMALMCLGNGVSVITERIFENRFMHVLELKRLGADIKIDGASAIVRGVPKLIGAPVMATDLRASASLVLAGLAAEGITEIHRIYHLDRGYVQMEKKLQALGAEIERVAVG